MKRLFRIFLGVTTGVAGVFCLAAEPETPAALARETFIYLFEIDREASLDGLPTLILPPQGGVPGASEALQRKVAERIGVPSDAVTLRGARFQVTGAPRLSGRPGEPPGLKVRVCPHGDPARRGELLAEAIVPPEGGVLLVPLERDRRRLVTAYFETLRPAGDGEGLVARQQAFHDDTRAALGPELPSGYLVAIGDCE